MGSVFLCDKMHKINTVAVIFNFLFQLCSLAYSIDLDTCRCRHHIIHDKELMKHIQDYVVDVFVLDDLVPVALDVLVKLPF